MRSRHVNAVALLQSEVAGGDKHFLVPLYGTDEEFRLDLFVEFHQRDVFQPREVRQPVFHQLQLALAKDLHLCRGGEHQYPHDLVCGGKFRIDDHRQPQIFPNQVHLLVILRHTHAGNGLFRAQPLADQAAENIHFVIGRCRDEQGGFVCSGFQLGFRCCPVALDAHNVQCVLALSQVGFITVYHGDVVSLLHQQGSQIAADLAVPNNYDFHN